jgi:superoxide dismutase
MADYVLPELDHARGALEPRISGQIKVIRHSKHQATGSRGLFVPPEWLRMSDQSCFAS